MVGIVLLGVFVLLLALGAPIAVCLGMSSVSAILVQGDHLGPVFWAGGGKAARGHHERSAPSVLFGEQ